MTQSTGKGLTASFWVSAVGIASGIYASYILTAQRTEESRNWEAQQETAKQTQANMRDIAVLQYRVDTIRDQLNSIAADRREPR